MTDNKNIVEVETEVTEVKEETVKTNVFQKAGNWVKTHGKTIAKGVGIAVGGVALYALGKASGSRDSDDSNVGNFDLSETEDDTTTE